MSDSGRIIGECDHGYQRWHCETCKLRAVADRLASIVARYLAETPAGHQPHMIVGEAEFALAEYRKAVG